MASSVSYDNTLLSPSKTIPDNSQKKSNEAALILIRHGESLWNEKNLFTGCVDVPLTEKGVEEAIEAGKRISNIPVDVIFTSSLIRAQMTAMLAMIQHRRKKVPIILHDESEQAKTWSQVFSDETKNQSIPVIPAWQLNERMYKYIWLSLSLNILSFELIISFICFKTFLDVGMENYKVLTSKKQPRDMGKSKFTNGVGVMIFLLPKERVWRCVLREQ
jgi:phosphohistidine phosphatase SixA